MNSSLGGNIGSESGGMNATSSQLIELQATRSIYDHSFKSTDGRVFQLKEFADRVILIVNVASQCGFTSQYAGLEELHRTYSERGLVVIGFPCNQFGNQEPGSDTEIQSFCSTRFNVTFLIASKIDVNGDRAHPLYQYLKQRSRGIFGTEAIKWNFTKFLVSRDGSEISRYAPTVPPESLDSDIERMLGI